MERGQRDLRGADQEQLVAGDLVDHLPLAREEAGAEQRALADEHRRDHRNEPLGADQLDREAHQGQLDQHQVAQQVGEARARGLARLLHLDPAVGEPQVEVVADLELELGALADLPQDHGVVLRGPFRSLRLRKVGKLGHAARRASTRPRPARPRAPSPRRSPGASRRSAARRPPRSASPPRSDRRRGSAARAAPRPRGSSSRRRSSRRSSSSRASAAPRRASAARAGSGSSRMLRRSSISGARWPGALAYWEPDPVPGCGGSPASRAGVLGDELGDADRVLAGDDVLGHDRAREAAVSDREQDVVEALGALVEVRALHAERPVGGALRSRRRQRVTARAALREQHRAAMRRGRPATPRSPRSRRRRGPGPPRLPL